MEETSYEEKLLNIQSDALFVKINEIKRALFYHFIRCGICSLQDHKSFLKKW